MAGTQEAPAQEALARAAPSARPGVIDTDTLRQRWPDVLEAVKSERRVAWMLLNTASVDSLEDGILTVTFAKEGQAKGFAASGHDQVLTRVLANMLGLTVRVRAAVGTVSGAHGARPAPADPGSRAGRGGRPAGSGVAGSGVTGSDVAGSGGAGLGGAGSRGAGTGGAGSRGAEPGGAGSGGVGPGDAGPGRGAGRPGNTADRPGDSSDEPGAPDVMPGGGGTRSAGPQASARSSGGASRAGGGAANPASSPPRPPGPRSGDGTFTPGGPAAADPEGEWPDDAGPADGGAGPTGMELIERHLGGTIIEEIDEP